MMPFTHHQVMRHTGRTWARYRFAHPTVYKNLSLGWICRMGKGPAVPIKTKKNPLSPSGKKRV